MLNITLSAPPLFIPISMRWFHSPNNKPVYELVLVLKLANFGFKDKN